MWWITSVICDHRFLSSTRHFPFVLNDIMIIILFWPDEVLLCTEKLELFLEKLHFGHGITNICMHKNKRSF